MNEAEKYCRDKGSRVMDIYIVNLRKRAGPFFINAADMSRLEQLPSGRCRNEDAVSFHQHVKTTVSRERSRRTCRTVIDRWTERPRNAP